MVPSTLTLVRFIGLRDQAHLYRKPFVICWERMQNSLRNIDRACPVFVSFADLMSDWTTRSIICAGRHGGMRYESSLMGACWSHGLVACLMMNFERIRHRWKGLMHPERYSTI